jgi:hypothetical protein
MASKIDFQKIRQDIAIPTASISTATKASKKKDQNLIYNLIRYISPNDTATIDYTKGGTPNHELDPLNNMFCDNMCLYYKIPLEQLTDQERQILLPKSKSKHTKEEAELAELVKPSAEAQPPTEDNEQLAEGVARLIKYYHG